MTQEASYVRASDALEDWKTDLLSGAPPTFHPVGEGFESIQIGPGLVTLIGGAPGAGKTALVMQWVFEALRLTPELNALVCNVEMTPSVLLDRQFARLADIDLTTIRHRRLDATHSAAIERGMSAMEDPSDRLAFLRPRFDLANVAAAADSFEAGLIVLDYIQRIGAPGEHGDRRGAVGATMDLLRQFADAGVAIIVVAALARQKDSKGRSSYSEGLGLASFRETSELEYGADDAFILVPADDENPPDDGSLLVTLKHLKSRHGETRDLALRFDRRRQRFAPSEPAGGAKAKNGKLQAKLRELWEGTPAQADDAS